MSAIISLLSSTLSQVHPVVLAVCIVFASLAIYLLLSSPSSSSSNEKVFEGNHWSLDLLMKECKIISREEIAKRNNETELWVTIDNWVFDLTRFLPRHPGGMKVLLNRAGQDCTLGFHGFQHPENAYNNLRDYIIGRLDPNERVQWFDKSDLTTKGLFEYKGSVYKVPVSSDKDAMMQAGKFVGYVRKEIPIEMVHTHDQEWDCWVMIRDKIYDVTHFSLSHPGGDVILSKPGQDVTSMFENQHKDNSRVLKKLEDLLVGTVLKK